MPKVALDRIAPEKRRRIFDTAAAEFAARGFAGANINEIAVRAGIGKGSIYLYFHSKKDLYLATALEGVRLAEEMWREAIADLEPGDFFGAVDRGIRTALAYSGVHRDYYLMYAHATYGGNAEFKGELVGLIRTFLETRIRPMIEAAQARGVVRDVDPSLAAFHYFTGVLPFQDALINPALFPGPPPASDEEVDRRIAGYLDLLRHGLARRE